MCSNSKEWTAGYVIKTGPTVKFFENKRSKCISGPQLKVKNQTMANCWTLAKDSLKLENKFVSYPQLFMMQWLWRWDFRKTDFIEPAESCPFWCKITLRREITCLVQIYRIVIWKSFFLISCQTLLWIWE